MMRWLRPLESPRFRGVRSGRDWRGGTREDHITLWELLNECGGGGRRKLQTYAALPRIQSKVDSVFLSASSRLRRIKNWYNSIRETSG